MRKPALTVILLGMVFCCSAQTLNTTFFLDHDNTRYRINPAFMPDDRVNGFFGFAIDGITLSTNTNVGLSSFIFPVDGGVATGFNSQIPAEQFLEGLKNKVKLNLGANINLFSAGFRIDSDSFTIIELNARSNSFANIPKPVFAFLKLGSSESNPDLGKVDASSENYLELAVGYSRKIGEKLQIGGRLKALGGLLGDGMLVNQIERYSNGSSTVGFGAAIDLGACYELLDGLELNAAVQDFGIISSRRSDKGKEAPNTAASPTAMAVPMVLRLGARYAMPFYERLSVGILETYRPSRYFSYNDTRLGMTVTPVDNISVAVNYGLTSYGSTMGLAVNFSVGPVQIFAGTDAMKFTFTPQGVPVNDWNTTVSAGLLFQFRTSKKDFKQKSDQ